MRSQLLKLFKALPTQEIGDHVIQILPYIRAGMTHLAADIRLAASETLSWLLDVAGNDVISCAGGFVQTMKAFLAMLGWHSKDPTTRPEAAASFASAGIDGKPVAVSLEVLGKFLNIGIGEEHLEGDQSHASSLPTSGRLVPYEQHRLPTQSDGFGYLNLFGGNHDIDTEMLEDYEERLKVFDNRFRSAVLNGLEVGKQSGGEVGRASALVFKVIPPLRRERESGS